MYIDLERFAQTPLVREPFEYLIVPRFITSAKFDSLMQDYPDINTRGSFPLASVDYNKTGAFSTLISELDGDAFRHAVEQKFSLDLTGRPTMFTVRGICSKKDGKIHTDSESKMITILIYMNPAWEKDGGRLRLLRSQNIDDVLTEIPPDSGTLLAFRRADNSFHGHKPYAGPRRVIQMNWVTEQKFVDHNLKRHGFSAWLKRLNPFADHY